MSRQLQRSSLTEYKIRGDIFYGKVRVSLYPEQERLEDIDYYLALASRYGFTKVFTSLFSVEGTKEEIIHYFRNLTTIAHRYGMKVSGDAHGDFLRKMGADDIFTFIE